MTDEERAREIAESLVAHMRRWTGDCACTTADHEVCGKWAESIAAALREARVEGARRMQERAVSVCDKRADTHSKRGSELGWAPEVYCETDTRCDEARDCSEWIGDIDPEEVVR